MRCNKNITLKLESISSHFTEKKKIITLSLLILMLSFVNIILCLSNSFSNSVSALSYESNVGIGFSFNPTLTISFSSSDLVISNLTPGTTSDSNDIVVSVSTNAAYGYTLSTNVGSNDITSPYYHSSDLIHSNNSNNGSNSNNNSSNNNHVFSSIATNANYSNLSEFSTNADINTWGYSTSLDSGTTWSSYNGLSTSTNTTLVDSNDMTSSNIDFKIAAKASDNQASGVYSNVINFIAVSKPIPMSLAEAYASEGKTMFNGYYTMQDMTSAICEKTEAIDSQLQVMDIRDRKIYWIAKLKDGHCWMTQNLNLDLDSNRTYTHYDTDLGWTALDENATWQPINSTIDFTGTSIANWANSYTEPYSASPGDVYYYTSGTSANDIKYNSLQDCVNAGHNDCAHYHAGNYYNWTAAVASNDTDSMISVSDALSSVCPKGWKLPKDSPSDFRKLGSYYGISGSTVLDLRNIPLYFARSGVVNSSILGAYGSYGSYWSSTVQSEKYARGLYFGDGYYNPSGSYSNRFDGYPVRCLAR